MTEYVLINCIEVNNFDIQKVLLVQKKKPTWMEGYFNLPGGKVEPGENIEDAAIREFHEETGLPLCYKLPPYLVGKLVSQHDVIYCYNIYTNDCEPKPRECEIEKIAWVRWSSVIHDKRLMPNLRIIIPLMMFGTSGWAINVDSPNLGKEYCDLNIKLPGDCHNNFDIYPKIDKFFEKKVPEPAAESIKPMEKTTLQKIMDYFKLN